MEVGLYEVDNGFWIGYKDLEFGLMRLRGGTEYWTPHTDFDYDILATDSDFQFDPTKSKYTLYAFNIMRAGTLLVLFVLVQ